MNDNIASLTVRILSVSPCWNANSCIFFMTSPRGAEMNTTNGMNSDVLIAFRACVANTTRIRYWQGTLTEVTGERKDWHKCTVFVVRLYYHTHNKVYVCICVVLLWYFMKYLVECRYQPLYKMKSQLPYNWSVVTGQKCPSVERQ